MRDGFPAPLLTETCGAAIEGELYEVPIDNIRTDFLPSEPAELELTVVHPPPRTPVTEPRTDKR